MTYLTRATACLLLLSSLAQADWRQFRGNETNGLSAGASTKEWAGTEQPIEWSAELPGRGLSSPIIIGDSVAITASSGPRQERLHVILLDAQDGTQIWERQFWATGRTVCHPKTSVAAPTPASDGERIFAFYSSNDLACLDLQGNLLWYRGLTYDFPNASNSLGMSSSLVVVGNVVIAMVESDDESFAIGLDTATGTTKWKVDRPRRANWTSPSLMENGDKTLVLLQSSAGVSALDPETGEEAWNYSDGASTIPTLVTAGSTAFVPSHGITALRPGTSNPKVPEILWQESALSPGTASPVVWGDGVYVVNGAGVMTKASLENGEKLWQARMRGPFSASPVVVGGKFYCINENGLAQVIDPADKGKTISTHEFNETVLGTPSVTQNGIYVRSDGHVWKVSLKY
ncbi:MAG: PQQ-binding-like beta-propeller repeat protein [Planctomycetaceae bacterium]|nr:PQQ-binding-like beta-propeller repeat protein [Planctomycetaceae bacterium]MCB9951713.1 PQQ-binding-like beta-propeller repeat protein [Planctomycetaceae bacterium]